MGRAFLTGRRATADFSGGMEKIVDSAKTVWLLRKLVPVRNAGGYRASVHVEQAVKSN
jgi:hypothetical protein